MFELTSLNNFPDTRTLGDRHLHGILKEKSFHKTNPNEKEVQIIVDPEYISMRVGQNLLFMLLNLLSRQFGIVSSIHLNVPDIETCDSFQKFGSSLPIALRTFIKSITLDRISVKDESAAKPLITIAVGFPQTLEANSDLLYVWADGWRCYVGKTVLHESVEDNFNPIGSLFAACIVASEIFKRVGVLRENTGMYADEFYYSLWDGKLYKNWGDLPLGANLDEITFPKLNIVGLGAVGQALSFALSLFSPKAFENILLIDNDSYDATNHNRCSLGFAEDVNNKTPKVSIVERWFQERGIKCHAYKGKWEQFIFDSPHREPNYIYEWVISCVDNNIARHAIQNINPNYILGGSTVGMSVNVTLYRSQSKYECLRCYNTPEKNLDSPEEIREILRNKTDSEIERLCQKVDADIKAVRDYLKKATCGTLGESEMKKFQSTSVEPSVGFSSVGAGVLLLSRLVRAITTNDKDAFPDYPNIMFNFLNLTSDSYPVLANPQCKCQHA